MTNEMMIITAVITLVLNAITPLFINQITLKKYELTHSAEKALHTMQSLKQYLQITFLALGAFSFTHALIQLSAHSAPSRWMFYITIVVYSAIIIVYGQLVFHRVTKKIRQTETTWKDEFTNTLKDLLIILIPLITYKLLRTYFAGPEHDNEWKDFGVYVIFLMIVQIVYPFLVYAQLSARPIQDKKIHKSIVAFMKLQHESRIGVYEFPSKKSKNAHAWVSGIIIKKIFIADYLIEKLTIAELHAVIAHEIGHCKKNHQLIKLGLFIMIYPMVMILNECSIRLETWIGGSLSFIYGLGFFVFFLLLYYVYIYQAVSRIHEHQADQYVLEVCEKDDLTSALNKLTKLNNHMTTFHRITEKFQSHPSLEKRITWIEQNSSYSS